MAKTRSGEQQRRYWQEVIQRQQASGQSIAKFCAKEKLGKATFYLWKRRLGEVGGVVKAARIPARQDLVPVRIVNDRPVSISNGQMGNISNDRPSNITNNRSDDRPSSIVNDRADSRPSSTANLEVQWPGGALLRVQGCDVRMVKAIVATISVSSISPVSSTSPASSVSSMPSKCRRPSC